MKYAVISDVHGNLEALEACLKKIDELRADKIICLGDLVDYCAQPNECIEILLKRADVIIKGNHDEAQYRYELSDGFTENARISSIHTREVLKPEYAELFKTLPQSFSEDYILFVHASPAYLPEYKYILTVESAAINFGSFTEKVCFVGHSHRPLIFKETGTGAYIVENGVIDRRSRYIINVGSVGQPRDGKKEASFGIFDSDSWKYANYRVKYDVLTASEKIRKEGLPEYLADRILKGV
jgi:predicted phosphodiesterase